MAVKLTKSKYIKGVHPSETPLGIYKDADTKDLRVFDEKGNIEAINAITIPGPQGPQGVAGPVGPTGASGINWMGIWNSGTTYAANDAVFYDGSSYFASNASTNDAPDDGAPWFPLAMQGATGPQGPQGPQGNTGPAGANFIKGADLTISIDEDTPTTYTQILSDLIYTGSPTVGIAKIIFNHSGTDKFGTGKVYYGELKTGAANINSQAFFTLRGDGGVSVFNITIRFSGASTGIVNYEIINHGADITSGSLRFNWLIV